MKKILKVIMLMLAIFMLTSCMKPYDEPEYVEVEPSETAFLIPLEDASEKQAKLDSFEALEKMMIMKKRIQISHRWHPTGRMPNSGKWIATVSLIKVDRRPVTREWASKKGTSDSDEGIWVESSDSIEFSTGFNCTAYIKESNAAKFLYMYPSGSLAKVMDEEVRNQIQQEVADFAAGYDLDDLRSKKKEIISQVRKIVIAFFEERGLTITTIGMFGGFEYSNPDIQKSIDEVFVAQQQKNVEFALLAAMENKKKRMLDEGEASANKAREEAKGKADAILLVKEAEAKGISLVNAALVEAKENPLFVQIKALEVESERINKWNGDVPQMIMGGGSGGFTPLMQIPALTKK